MSPKRIARAAGVLYLITIVAGIIGQGFIADRLVSANDASLTAQNIAAHRDLFRFAYTLFMIEQVAQIATSILFYELLKLQGWLILRSTFLPRALGWLAVFGGIGWLTYLWPPFGSRLFVPIALFALLGSFATIAWLLVYGVNEERWNAQAARK